MTKRIDWIDVTKGIGVLCVIFGHISFYLKTTLLQMFVYGFSVFIFFVISGINFDKKIKQPITKVIKGLFKNLVVPYLICVLMIVVFKYIYYDGVLNVREVVFNYITQVNYRSLWYVPVLLFSQLATWLLCQIVHNSKARLTIIIIFYLCFVLLNENFDISFLWNLNYVAYGTFYLYIGIILKDKIMNFNNKWYINLSISILLMCVSCFSTYYNYVTNVLYNYISFRNVHIISLSIISAITGTISIILLAKTIHKCRFLSYLGKNSFSFIAFNIETIALILDETQINQLFWYGNKIPRTILYMALMIIGLALLNIIYKFIYNKVIFGLNKIASYNTTNKKVII